MPQNPQYDLIMENLIMDKRLILQTIRPQNPQLQICANQKDYLCTHVPLQQGIVNVNLIMDKRLISLTIRPQNPQLEHAYKKTGAIKPSISSHF